MGQAEDHALQSAAGVGDVAALREAVRNGAQLECKDWVRPPLLRCDALAHHSVYVRRRARLYSVCAGCHTPPSMALRPGADARWHATMRGSLG